MRPCIIATFSLKLFVNSLRSFIFRIIPALYTFIRKFGRLTTKLKGSFYRARLLKNLDRIDVLQRRGIADAVRHFLAVEATVGSAVDDQQQETRNGGQDTGSHQTERRQLFRRENGPFLELEVAKTGQNVGERHRGEDAVQFEDNAQAIRQHGDQVRRGYYRQGNNQVLAV